MDASAKQPVCTDQRNQTDFIIARGQSMKEMGYVKTALGKDAFDWSLMEKVITENRTLYDGLKLKSA